jgi:hypothetical protein
MSSALARRCTGSTRCNDIDSAGNHARSLRLGGGSAHGIRDRNLLSASDCKLKTIVKDARNGERIGVVNF